MFRHFGRNISERARGKGLVSDVCECLPNNGVIQMSKGYQKYLEISRQLFYCLHISDSLDSYV